MGVFVHVTACVYVCVHVMPYLGFAVTARATDGLLQLERGVRPKKRTKGV